MPKTKELTKEPAPAKSARSRRRPSFGSIYQRDRIWWLKYYKDGRVFYESSHSKRYTDALRLLETRRVEIVTGSHVGTQARRIKVGELLNDLETHYEVNGQSVEWIRAVARKHLRPAFGVMKVARLNRAVVQGYVKARLSSGAANGTVNRETSILHRALTLARDGGKLTVVPPFPKKLREDNVRKGFFEADEYEQLLPELAEYLQPLVRFAYRTGCRRGEILGLRWAQVDLTARVVRLEAGETKNRQPRIIPLSGELVEVLTMQKAIRDHSWPGCEWVFFRNGQRVKSIKNAWVRACYRAGLRTGDAESGKPTRLFHDLRRTGARNLVRAGVPERVVMAIGGWKTRSVFDRYNVTSERDLHDAARRLDSYLEEGSTRRRSPRNGDNLGTVDGGTAKSSSPTPPKLLN